MNHVDSPFESPVILSFCSGVLGLERGLARAGVNCRVAAYVEIEAFILANLVAGMEAGILDPVPIWTDIKTFQSSIFRGKVHGIIGGYPCQPFSQNGKRRGKDDPRHLWPYIKKHIEAARPIWCFFENVPGHLTCGYEQVRNELEEMDFTVKEGVYSAAECGATIQRERLFILAISNSSRRGQDWEQTKLWASGVKQSPCNSGNSNKVADQQKQESRWPANPFSEQHEWEERRVVESGLGITINGYNFKNDLLRAIGNSVVEQAAAIAFLDLLKNISMIKTSLCINQ